MNNDEIKLKGRWRTRTECAIYLVRKAWRDAELAAYRDTVRAQRGSASLTLWGFDDAPKAVDEIHAAVPSTSLRATPWTTPWNGK